MTAPARWWKRRLTKWISLGIAVVLLVLAAWLGLRKGFSPRPAPLSKLLVRAPVAVAPGVYLLGKCSPAAVYLVETSKGLVLIDSGLEPDAATVTDQIADLGFDVKEVRAILLTHVHADHTLGAEFLRRLTGAKVYAGRADCPPLRKGRSREAFFGISHLPHLAPHPTTVDVALGGGETLSFGETRIAVIAAPGHTQGSLCYLLTRQKLRVLFAGDVIQQLSRARRGNLGTYAAYLPPVYRGDARDYLATLRRLAALPVPDLVLPGHPEMDPIPQNPHVSAQHYSALLGQGIAEMKQLVARFEADGANFLDGIPKELLPGLYYLGDCRGSAVYCIATAKDLFLWGAPAGPLLGDFLVQRFKQFGLKGRKPTAIFLTSADKQATAGLAALVRGTGCVVVAPRAGLDKLQRLCGSGTNLISADDWQDRGGFRVRTIALEGRGFAPVAYEVRWAGKTLLFSGPIPQRLTVPTVAELGRAVKQPGGSARAYLASLARLARAAPQLWLPAVPAQGQNANLYDDDWQQILEGNRQVVAETIP